MAKKIKKPDHETQAYGAYDDSMNLIYATIRATKEACEEQLHRFNPPVSGHHYPFKVLPLVIGAYSAHQPALNLEDTKN